MALKPLVFQWLVHIYHNMFGCNLTGLISLNIWGFPDICLRYSRYVIRRCRLIFTQILFYFVIAVSQRFFPFVIDFNILFFSPEFLIKIIYSIFIMLDNCINLFPVLDQSAVKIFALSKVSRTNKYAHLLVHPP